MAVLELDKDNGLRKGNQTPRYSHIPTYFTSAADDAIDLAAVAGLNLMPWQEYVLRGSLGEKQDGRWATFVTCLVMPRQNGKNALIEARQLAGMFLFGETHQTHTAHEVQTSAKAMDALANRIIGVPELAEYIPGYDRDKEQSLKDIEGIRMGNGKRIMGIFKDPLTGRRQERYIEYIARTGSGGRGFTGDVLYLDEAYAIKEAEMGALLPTLRAKSLIGNPQVWVTSSAGMVDSVYLESLRRQGISGDDESLAYFEWSANDEKDRPEDDPIEWDREEWYRSNPSLGYLVSEEHMAKEIQTLSNTESGVEELQRELLGIWSSSGTRPVFNHATWSKHQLVGKSRIRLDRPCIGVDVSPDRSGASISITGQYEGKYVTQVLFDESGTGWVAERVQGLQMQSVESGRGKIPVVGIGNSATQALEADFRKNRVAIRWLNTSQYAQACADYFDMIHQDNLYHLGQEALDAAIYSVRKKDKGGGLFTWEKDKPTDNIRPAVGSTIATFGAKLRKDAFAEGSKKKNRNHSF